MEVAATMPQTRLINVGDREADFFELSAQELKALFDEQRNHPCVDLLVRAQHDRGVIGEPFKLFEAIRQAELKTEVQVKVPRQWRKS